MTTSFNVLSYLNLLFAKFACLRFRAECNAVSCMILPLYTLAIGNTSNCVLTSLLAGMCAKYHGGDVA